MCKTHQPCSFSSEGMKLDQVMIKVKSTDQVIRWQSEFSPQKLFVNLCYCPQIADSKQVKAEKDPLLLLVDFYRRTHFFLSSFKDRSSRPWSFISESPFAATGTITSTTYSWYNKVLTSLSISQDGRVCEGAVNLLVFTFSTPLIAFQIFHSPPQPTLFPN